MLTTELTEDPAADAHRMKVTRLEKARKDFEDDGDDWLDRD